MHAGKNYSFKEVIIWTRRDIYKLFLIATASVICYKFLGWNWLAVPWLPIALLGTAVAFVVGFKNNASYDRLWEARRIWGSIVNTSRSFGIMVKDFIPTQQSTQKSKAELQEIRAIIMKRHFAWLTAMRFSLREKRTWEAIYKRDNAEYRDAWFSVPEQKGSLHDELARYLSEEELQWVLTKSNKAAQLISLQSAHLKSLHEQGLIESFRHIELERCLAELYNQQGASERIKNFPYPRQYATANLYFIKLFTFLVPLGLLQEFDRLGEYFIWLVIPFSTLSTWVFTTMEKIGESSESPFEGSANDVPITAISRTIEIDLREMHEMSDIPPPLKPENNILV